MSKQALNAAFRDFRKAGFFARQNFMCCTGCACAAIPEETEKAVYYHRQDADTLAKHGQVHLGFGKTEEHGKQLVEILHKHGLLTKWDGSLNEKILVIVQQEVVS